MPNWCENDLEISGPATLVEEAVAKISGPEGEIDFNKIVPEPENNPDWYKWRVENWGCKWNASETQSHATLVKTKKKVEMSFQTPWAPPLPVMKKLGELYPGLTISIRYYECGMEYQGHYKVQRGEVKTNMTKGYRGSRGG